MRVRRRASELIAPAKPTPRGLKYLSDIDDQRGLRFHMPVLQIYKKSNDDLVEGLDPANVLRKAIAEVLVYYYPFAGRLRKVRSDGKLAVDCTAEGVMFTEAEADFTVDEFGDVVQIPILGWEELLFDVPGTSGVLGTPLLLFQVTKLKCGGVVVGTRLNHSMTDAGGIAQFLIAVSEMARGAAAPSLRPVWRRELLNARNPPSVTCVHQEFENIPGSIGNMENKVLRSFVFGPDELSALRELVRPHIAKCSTFELLAAVLWRARTAAMGYDPSQEVQMICVVGARHKFNPPLPEGYYGNVIAHPVVKATAGSLTSNPLSYAIKLIQTAKESVTHEYMKSLADYLVLNGRLAYTGTAYLVSDLTRVGLEDIDYGWGKAIYGGPARIASSGMANFFVPLKRNGEKVIGFSIYLPPSAMDLFAKEISRMLEASSSSNIAPPK